MKVIRNIAILFAIAVVAILVYPMRGGKSLREATADEVCQQVPAALDILAARHPIVVGILRTGLNGDGSVDRFAENYMRSSMSLEKAGTLDCYIAYYAIAFNQDEFRQELATGIEKQLGLA